MFLCLRDISHLKTFANHSLTSAATDENIYMCCVVSLNNSYVYVRSFGNYFHNLSETKKDFFLKLKKNFFTCLKILFSFSPSTSPTYSKNIAPFTDLHTHFIILK